MRAQAALWIGAVLYACCMSSSEAQQKGQEKAPPCATSEYRQFDFWLGQWDVTAKGKHAGTNRISAILGGCVIMEEWEGAGGGYAGKSLNRYDPQSKRWEQFWMDNQGGILRLSGEYKDDKMVLAGETTVAGSTVVDRVTWHNNSDGTVRQVWEKSKDGGKTWSTAFDGLYVKKE